MKKGLLLWICWAFSCSALGNSYLAKLDDFGEVALSESPLGLRTELRLQLEPRENYRIRLLNACQALGPYRTHFRHNFTLDGIADDQGRWSRSSYFHGMNEKDLRSRNLNTLALYKLEKSYWRKLHCVALQTPGADAAPTEEHKP